MAVLVEKDMVALICPIRHLAEYGSSVRLHLEDVSRALQTKRSGD
jgi:hypothetical protein